MTVEDTTEVINLLKTLTLDERKHVRQQLDITIAPQTTATTTTKKKAPGEETIQILKLFQTDLSDTPKTVDQVIDQVLDLGLVKLGTVKLGKKNVDVLRNMVTKVGPEYIDNVGLKMKELSFMKDLEDLIQLDKKDVDVLRKMVEQVGPEYLGLELEYLGNVDRTLTDLKRTEAEKFLVNELANLKTEIEKRFLVNELIRYKRRLASPKKMPPAA